MSGVGGKRESKGNDEIFGEFFVGMLSKWRSSKWKATREMTIENEGRVSDRIGGYDCIHKFLGVLQLDAR